MLIERRLREGLTAGTIDACFRRWRRPQVVAGRRYRTSAGMVEVEAVDVIDPAAITDEDARRAGYAGPDDARSDLRAGDWPVYRIILRRVAEPDPRDVLAADDRLDAATRAELARRLAGMDATSDTGPWTTGTLTAIAANPGLRAADLAASLGATDLLAFKLRVRRLKALGLTLSLPVGYRLSPRGAAFLRGD